MRFLFFAVLLHDVLLTETRVSISTGGPLPSDWEDTYPGCRSALIEGQLAADAGSYVPVCASEHEACITAANALAERSQQSFELCRCLGRFKECARETVDQISFRNGTRIAPLGCPEIMFSRICALQEDVVRKGLSFTEDAQWSCSSCADSVQSYPESCAAAVRNEQCDCHFQCPDDYSSSCDGYRCHSISCLLSMMNCWIDQGCRDEDAWYLCLYDQSILTYTEKTKEYVPGVRGLGCRLQRCREAIVHLDPSSIQAYTWIGLYAVILVLGICILWVSHSNGMANNRALTKRYGLGTRRQDRGLTERLRALANY